MMSNKTKIILTRHSAWMNRLRSYTVYIDNREAGSIRNGSSEEFSIAPGAHQVQCKMAWYSSQPFTVNVDENKIEYLVVKSGIKYYWLMFVLLLTGLLINAFHQSRGEERPMWIFVLQFALILPALCYMLYYLTVGRKNYLLIEEDKENIFSN